MTFLRAFLKPHRLFCSLFVVLLCAPVAHAQEVDSTLAPRFQLAESYLRAAQFDRAIRLLEDLYRASPSTLVFYQKLKEAYENVKRYDDAIALVDARQAYDNNQTLLFSEKARLQYLKGDEETAYASWDAAIDTAPDNPNVYRFVYQSLTQVRLFERAILILERGRERLGDPTRFQADLGYMYSLTGQHEEAMDEYLGLIAQNDRQVSLVRSRLSRAIEQDGALTASITATERAVRRDPLNTSYRDMLGWLYMEAGQYREAFDVSRALDRMGDEEGRVLFEFALKAADAAAYDVALDAYEEILRRYPDAPILPEADRGKAEMHERWADKVGERAFDDQGNRLEGTHYAQAEQGYRAFLRDYPTHPQYPFVLRQLGHLQQEVFFSLEEAEATLREVVQRYPNSSAADQAEYDLGLIALTRDQLPEARLIFSRLEQRLRTGELAERARFETAMIHFYEGSFEAALTLVEAMKENTSTDMANDAIDLKVLLIENKGPDSLNTPLGLFAEAKLHLRQRQPEASIIQLQTVMQTYGNHPLADDARFLYAKTLRSLGSSEDALVALRELPLMFPQSFLADQSVYLAAQIQEQDLGDTQEAIRLYTQLLSFYPGSLLATEARARIRALRGDDV